MASIDTRDIPATPDIPAVPRRSAIVMIGLVSGPFISMVDSNAVNVAIPQIARDLNAPLATVGWTISAYLLGIAACLPVTAWLARRLGTRRAYAGALVAFALTSAACALAPTIETLVAFRALQGITSAPLIPLSLSLMFGGHSRMRPPSAAAMFFFLAPALGPTFGGLISSTVGWRPIFLINVPIVALGLVGVRRIAADPRRDDTNEAGLDLVGLLQLAAGATLAIYGASVVTGEGWREPTGLPLCAAGIMLLAGYGVYQRNRRRRARPVMLSLGLLADAASRTAVGVCVVASVVLFGVHFLMPVYLVSVQGHSPLVAGLVLFPQGLAMGVSSGMGERLVKRFGLRFTVLIGMLILAATTGLLLDITLDTPPWQTALLLIGRGAALGLTLQPLITGLLTRFGPAEVTDVSTVFNVTQRVAGSLGIAAVAAFYQERAATALGAGLRPTVLLLIALGATGILLAAFLPRGASAEAAPATPGLRPSAQPQSVGVATFERKGVAR